MIRLTIEVDENHTKEDLVKAFHAEDAYVCIEQITDLFREPRKYGTFDSKELTEKECDLMQSVCEKIFEIILDLPCKT